MPQIPYLLWLWQKLKKFSQCLWSIVFTLSLMDIFHDGQRRPWKDKNQIPFQLLEGLRNTSPWKWKQITSTLLSIPPPSLSGRWFCVSDRNSPPTTGSWGSWHTGGPFHRKPPSGIPERLKVPTATGHLLWEKKSSSVNLLEPEPSLFHVSTPEFNHSLTHVSILH